MEVNHAILIFKFPKDRQEKLPGKKPILREGASGLKKDANLLQCAACHFVSCLFVTIARIGGPFAPDLVCGL